MTIKAEWLAQQGNFRTACLYEYLRSSSERRAISELRKAGFTAKQEVVEFWFKRFKVDQDFSLKTKDGDDQKLYENVQIASEPRSQYEAKPEVYLIDTSVRAAVADNAYESFTELLQQSPNGAIEEAEIHVKSKNILFYTKVDEKPTVLEYTYCEQGCVVSHGKKRNLMEDGEDYTQLAIRDIVRFLATKKVTIHSLKLIDSGVPHFFKCLLEKLGEEHPDVLTKIDDDNYTMASGCRVTAKRINIESPTDNCFEWIGLCNALTPKKISISCKDLDEKMMESVKNIFTQKLEILTINTEIALKKVVGITPAGWKCVPNEERKKHVFEKRVR